MVALGRGACFGAHGNRGLRPLSRLLRMRAGRGPPPTLFPLDLVLIPVADRNNAWLGAHSNDSDKYWLAAGNPTLSNPKRKQACHRGVSHHSTINELDLRKESERRSMISRLESRRLFVAPSVPVPIGGSSAWLAQIDSDVSRLIGPAAGPDLAAAPGWPVDPGAIAIGPGHGRQQHSAAGAERSNGRQGPSGKGPQAGRCRWPAAHDGRLQKRPREAHGVPDLQS